MEVELTDQGIEQLQSVEKMSRDLREAAATMGKREARYLVDTYYTIQEDRMRAGSQLAQLGKSGEPNEILEFFSNQTERLEKMIKSALDKFSDSEPDGNWMRKITGVGPVIAAGLISNIDITRAPTVGHIWRYAGLDPTNEWLGTAKAVALVNEVMGAENKKVIEEVLSGEKKVTPEHLEEVAKRLDRTVEDIVQDILLAKPKLTDNFLDHLIAGKVTAAALKMALVANKPTPEHLAEISKRINRKVESIKKIATIEKGKGKGTITTASLKAALAKRPWNARLKTLCYKLGESFVKVQNLDSDIYGGIFRDRKTLEWERNLNGNFSQQAIEILAEKNFNKTTDAYKWYSGKYTMEQALGFLASETTPPTMPKAGADDGPTVQMLPPAHIHARSRRYAVKLFLSHLHGHMYFQEYGEEPPLPYPIAFLDHAHMIERPS